MYEALKSQSGHVTGNKKSTIGGLMYVSSSEMDSNELRSLFHRLPGLTSSS